MEHTDWSHQGFDAAQARFLMVTAITTHAESVTSLASFEEPSELMCALPRRLVGADDLEVLVDEDVVRPVDADVVDLVLAVAQLHDTVDHAPGVGG